MYIPYTAITMPQVRVWRYRSVHPYTVALTTALSKPSETSSTDRTDDPQRPQRAHDDAALAPAVPGGESEADHGEEVIDRGSGVSWTQPWHGRRLGSVFVSGYSGR